MAKRDILKEAIADAKTVKETAIANAKAALEEAFSPRLKEMLAAKLEEMDLDEEKEAVTEETVEETTVEEVKEETAEGLDEEINLDEILAEIELDEEDKEIKEDEASDKEEEEADKDMEDEEIDLEDMSDDDLKNFIEDVIADMVASGELEAGENFEEEDEDTEEEVGMEVNSEEEVEISETEIEEAKKDKESDEVKETKDEEDLKEAKSEEDDEKKKMEEAKKDEELKEAYDTIETLKSDLNEVNLLNAKLLYTNKIFKAKTLTESQKVKVLGAFDKAGTVKETKLVFETLNEGLKTKKTSMIKESLGSASRVSTNVNAKKPIIETDPMVARFQKLAGLK
jgi:hypothetical protein